MPAPGNRPDASILAALRAQIPAPQSFDVVETTFEPRDPVAIPEPVAKRLIPHGSTPEWCRDFVNGSIAASLQGRLVRDPAEIERERAENAHLWGSYAIPGEPVARIDLSGYRAGDLLRVLNAHPGTVSIEGTGTEADGRYALEQFVEDGPGFGTARLRRIGA